MTTQKHKWLPEQPTQEMLDAERFASSLAYESHEVQAVEVYKAMWQAALAVEPLSEDFVIDLILKCGDQPLDFMDFVKEIEKAHGIGVE